MSSSLIIFIITAAYFVYKSKLAKKMAENKPAQPTQDGGDPFDFDTLDSPLLRKLFGNEPEDTEVQTKIEPYLEPQIEYQPEPISMEEDAEEYYSTESIYAEDTPDIHQRQAMTVESLYVPITPSESLINSETIIPQPIANQNHLSVETPLTNLMKDFTVEKAVIYSSILRPKYLDF